MTRITGHLRDALQGLSAADGFSVIDQEFQLGAEQVADLASTTFLGSSNNGIAVAVDSSTTYAGINRSTYSAWGSYEAAASAALAFTHLDDMREAIRDNDRGGQMDMILCPHNQVTNIGRLAGMPAIQNSGYRVDLTASGGQLQLAALETGIRFGAARVVGVGDLTNTEIYGLSTPGIKIVSRRGLDVRQDQSGDDDVYQISMAMTLVVPRPHLCGKLTAVTA